MSVTEADSTETRSQGSEFFGGVLVSGFCALVVWFMAWGPGSTEDRLSSNDLISKMHEAGIRCELVDSFDPPGPLATVYERGSCRTAEGPVLFFLYSEAQDRSSLPDYVDDYTGNYAIVDDDYKWALVAEPSQAEDIAAAVDADVEFIESQPGLSVPATSGDLDCDSPGVGTNVYVGTNDPHGFDADNDGIGCES